jgi:hypothetical protein
LNSVLPYIKNIEELWGKIKIERLERASLLRDCKENESLNKKSK